MFGFFCRAPVILVTRSTVLEFVRGMGCGGLLHASWQPRQDICDLLNQVGGGVWYEYERFLSTSFWWGIRRRRTGASGKTAHRSSRSNASVDVVGNRQIRVAVFQFDPFSLAFRLHHPSPVFVCGSLLFLAFCVYQTLLPASEGHSAHDTDGTNDPFADTKIRRYGIGFAVVRPHRTRHRRLYDAYLRHFGVAHCHNSLVPGSHASIRTGRVADINDVGRKLVKSISGYGSAITALPPSSSAPHSSSFTSPPPTSALAMLRRTTPRIRRPDQPKTLPPLPNFSIDQANPNAVKGGLSRPEVVPLLLQFLVLSRRITSRLAHAASELDLASRPLRTLYVRPVAPPRLLLFRGIRHSSSSSVEAIAVPIQSLIATAAFRARSASRRFLYHPRRAEPNSSSALHRRAVRRLNSTSRRAVRPATPTPHPSSAFRSRHSSLRPTHSLLKKNTELPRVQEASCARAVPSRRYRRRSAVRASQEMRTSTYPGSIFGLHYHKTVVLLSSGVAFAFLRADLPLRSVGSDSTIFFSDILLFVPLRGIDPQETNPFATTYNVASVASCLVDPRVCSNQSFNPFSTLRCVTLYYDSAVPTRRKPTAASELLRRSSECKVVMTILSRGGLSRHDSPIKQQHALARADVESWATVTIAIAGASRRCVVSSSAPRTAASTAVPRRNDELGTDFGFEPTRMQFTCEVSRLGLEAQRRPDSCDSAVRLRDNRCPTRRYEA
ncbi:hypothetical protein B0H12DRAFT_1082182 [Mycena haematopus]|nr:hypothetical protein B0H12DRAFT_1082182 [Mycena haematopus]